MSKEPIFSENLLSHYLSDFRLSNVTDIRRISLLIKGLIEELDSGKIKSMKEEEIKPRFINTFFGDILGFNYGNSSKWQLKDEKKSIVDGTKPDSTLGYFFVDSKLDVVRAVIEIKDAKTDLDEKQNRDGNRTPVEQAFSYVAKSGGECKWVIVSNVQEIRFYQSTDASKFQKFLLKDLENEIKLKELLFLFHKDRFINEFEKSRTDKLLEYSKEIHQKDDKPIHIIDRIYTSLKRFEGFGFVDPNYLATISPFNILDEHVWQYRSRNLFTINSEIYELLSGINIENDAIIFSKELQNNILDFNVLEAQNKLIWAFKFLNYCLIDEISAIKDYRATEIKSNVMNFSHRHRFSFNEGEDGITKNISLIKNIECDCINCNYRNLELNKLLTKLKSAEGNEDYCTSEYAYGNYIVASNNFKTSYSLLKNLEKESKGKEDKAVQYFLAKLNIKLLHNLMLDYELDDKRTIMLDIKSVDLDKVIYDEIEFYLDKEVRKYLIDVKEEVLIFKIQDEIDAAIEDIEKLDRLYKNGGKRTAGANVAFELWDKYILLHYYINRNYITYDIFSRYKDLTEKFFRGMVICSHIPDYGIISFNTFTLQEAILNINPSSLKEILINENHLKVDEGCVTELLKKLNNFLTSSVKDGIFSEPHMNSLLEIQLNN